MPDILSKEKRSTLMSKIRSKDTLPEMLVRRLTHGMGYRYRLHVRALPGCPDLVFPARKKVIFVHGCFWHRHSGCSNAVMPKTRRDLWREKFTANKLRDKRNLQKLKSAGWSYLVLWECELGNTEELTTRIHDFLEENQSHQ